MSSRTPSLLAALTALVLAAPATALDSLEEVQCICADDVLNTGDYVSCVSHLTRRLVETGVLTRDERQVAVSDASAADLDAMAAGCTSEPGGQLAGWGVSAHVDKPFYRYPPSPSAFWEAVHLTLRLWNYTEDDVFQSRRTGSTGPGCLWEFRVLDTMDRVVARTTWACTDDLGTLDMPVGSLVEEDYWLGLVAENADPSTGLIEGEHLPRGVYEIQARWVVEGPQDAAGLVFEGGDPLATITVRIR